MNVSHLDLSEDTFIMNYYQELTQIDFVRKEDLFLVEYTAVPFDARFSGTWRNKLMRSYLRSRYVFANKDVVRVSFTNMSHIKLNSRFSTYRDNTNEITLRCFFNPKETELKLHQLMAKRRRVLLNRRRSRSNSKWTAANRSCCGFHFSILNKPNCNINPENGSSQVADSSGTRQNVPEFRDALGYFSWSRSCLYRWKRKKVLSKEDLDDELDLYMTEIKLKEPSDQTREIKDELDIDELTEEVNKFLELDE